MRHFLQENKLQLILLCVPVLCLIVLWNINIYKIWYDHTPWKKYESPPSKIVKILRVDFPYFSFYVSKLSEQSPGLEIYAKDGRVYSLDGKGQWGPGHYPDNTDFSWILSNHLSADEIACVTRIQNSWELEDEQDPNSRLIDARGSCSYDRPDNDQYVVYKIMQNGNVLEKYIDGEEPAHLRKRITLYLCLFIVLSAPVWTDMFIHIDPIKMKPELKAK